MSEAKQTSQSRETRWAWPIHKGLNVVFPRIIRLFRLTHSLHLRSGIPGAVLYDVYEFFLLDAVVDMSAYFDVLPFLLIPFIPAITMRAWAEEHAQHTFEMLMTLPLHPLKSSWANTPLPLPFTQSCWPAVYPLSSCSPFWASPIGPNCASYLGALLLGAFFSLLASLHRD